MNCVGIDPGLDGAVAYLRDAQEEPVFYDFPTIDAGTKSQKRREVNLPLLAVIFTNIHDDITSRDPGWERSAIYVEKPPPVMKGKVGNFKSARTFGQIEGLLVGLGMPYIIITPVSWKRRHSLLGCDKEASRQKALQLWPSAADDLARKKDHGRAEAALIAMFGRMNLAAMGVSHVATPAAV